MFGVLSDYLFILFATTKVRQFYQICKLLGNYFYQICNFFSLIDNELRVANPRGKTTLSVTLNARLDLLGGSEFFV